MRNLLRNPLMLIFLALILMQSLQNGIGGLIESLMDIVYMIPGLVIGLSFHEFAHAKVAVLCGDDTPRLQGRVTINPAAHIDPVGLFALVFLRFGWGKAVEINPRNFKNRRRDEILVGLAGVTMNLVIAVLVTMMLAIVVRVSPQIFRSEFGTIVFDIFWYVLQINLVLMLFNLIPVPPLDGFNVLANVLDFREKPIYYRIYQYGWVILMALILFRLTSYILFPALNFLMSLAFRIIFLM